MDDVYAKMTVALRALERDDDGAGVEEVIERFAKRQNVERLPAPIEVLMAEFVATRKYLLKNGKAVRKVAAKLDAGKKRLTQVEANLGFTYAMHLERLEELKGALDREGKYLDELEAANPELRAKRARPRTT